MRLFVVLQHQIQTWSEKGVNVHDPLEKVAIQFVFKHVASLLNSLVLRLNFFIDLDGQVFNVFF